MSLGQQIELVRHSAVPRHRTDLHFPYHIATMKLYRHLADSDVSGNLHTETVSYDLDHDLALAAGAGCAVTAVADMCLADLRNGASSDSASHLAAQAMDSLAAVRG